MTLITTSGSATADSYASLVEAAAYHTARGNAAWAALASDTVREQCLRKATDYMVQTYRQAWAGYRTTSTQALDWPRYDVPMRDGPSEAFYPSDTIPGAVVNACAELALKAATAALAPDLTQGVKRKKVGPVEIEYQDYSRSSKTYRAIDNLLSPYLGAAGGLRVVRA